MLTGKQKSELHGIAQTKKLPFQMGKDTVSEDLIEAVSDSLEVYELAKVSLLKTCVIVADGAAVIISATTHSKVVQVIGCTFMLYRRSKKNKLGLQYIRITVPGGALDSIHNGCLQITERALKQSRVNEM